MSAWDDAAEAIGNLWRRVKDLTRRVGYLEQNAERLLPAYGEIHCYGMGGTLTLTLAATWYQVVNFDTAGQSENTTPSVVNDEIKIDVTGIYLVTVSVAIESDTATEIEINVQKNNGVTSMTNLYSSIDPSAGDKVSVSLSGLASLTDGETLELWVRSRAMAGVVVVVEDANLSVVRVN